MHFPLFLCLYESFWKGFESETVNIAGYQMRLLVWRVVNKTLKFLLTFLSPTAVLANRKKLDAFTLY